MAGLAYAWCMDNTRTGRYLADKHSWTTLFAGNLLSTLALGFLVPMRIRHTVFHLSTAFGVGLILRCFRHKVIRQEQIQKELSTPWETAS